MTEPAKSVVRVARIIARSWNARQDGSPEYVVTWQITAGPTAGTRVRQRIGWRSENQAKFSWKTLRLLGFRGDDLAGLDAAELVPEHEIEISQRVADNGKTYVDVSVADWVSHPPPAGAVATLSRNTAMVRQLIDRELGVVPAAAERAREPGDDDGAEQFS